MKTTSNSSITTDTNYDVITKLEAQGRHETAQWMREKKEEYAQLARTYLAERPKKLFYTAWGYPTDMDGNDDDFYRLVPYTDEEIQRIKELFVELWNQDPLEEDVYVNTYDDIPQDELTCDNFGGKNDELDRLVWGRSSTAWFDATRLDLRSGTHAYYFRTLAYHPETKEMEHYGDYRLVELTEEEYLYLLTEQLFNKDFSFNRLILYNPSLAQKICDATDPGQELGIGITHSPYLILMNEVLEDAEQIRKSMDLTDEE
ncbi:MAG: hypothetical protein ACI30H_08385 [Paludibacteraceae bacterium]